MSEPKVFQVHFRRKWIFQIYFSDEILRLLFPFVFRVQWCLCTVLAMRFWWFTVYGEDPYIYFTWNVTYGTISPHDISQQAILIDDHYP
ncbi:hypothetical protein MtrunA17_Chr2g0285391 [Medicago truncatula]|uniref:Uncharacterized protein n=1 Tax=Medicago truncatula TaxID=3880 RepID=G7IP28_MEDTR|nr:hypothetical protein MTR_2g018640 [Medicago truncatula]RHN72228.1 hypothetical protein MtrunA17_Chr2g0285391 [Medicago truncatula]